MKISPQSVRLIRQRLLSWYDRHRRDLPWRKDHTGVYGVLVSEMMLQQTQVATVIAYYQRFIGRFPTVGSLAEADEREVLKLWQGLGYYRRARHLHAAAKTVVEKHGGRFPETVDGLRHLPGVGRYTAGAVASISMGIRTPVVDGNVARVLARVFAIDDLVGDKRTIEKIWSLAGELVDAKRPGDFNQALMELGALVCLPKPREPACGACPLHKVCRARLEGKVDRLPNTAGRVKPRGVTHHVAAIRGKAGRYLFVQRPDKGLWSKMWQMPTHEGETDDASMTSWLKEHLGLRVCGLVPVMSFAHQTTHRTIRFEVHAVTVDSGKLRRGAGIWRRLGDLDDLPLPNPQRRIIERLCVDNTE